MNAAFNIIDISQPIAANTACFPGDIPFSHQVTVNYQQSGVMNLCAFTMSPHVGTHADAPIHIHGDMARPAQQSETVGQMALSPFIGPAAVVDLSPWHEAVTWPQMEQQLNACPEFPKRILLKTQARNRAECFEPPYAWPVASLIHELGKRGVVLIGIDTPSVDHVDSKSLETHHALLETGIYWLENLDLTHAPVISQTQHGESTLPFLVALPLKLMEIEASPVRAVLLTDCHELSPTR